MRRFNILAVIALALAVSAAARAQETFENAAYALELPNATWKATSRSDNVHQHTEFIYGDRLDGFLQIRKEVVDAGAKPGDLAARDRDQKLRFLPGYVEGKDEPFSGRLNGVAFNYEYTYSGKPMTGRIYYLQADNRTIYVLRFTGLRDRLGRIRNQTDIIARSFRLK